MTCVFSAQSCGVDKCLDTFNGSISKQVRHCSNDDWPKPSGRNLLEGRRELVPALFRDIRKRNHAEPRHLEGKRPQRNQVDILAIKDVKTPVNQVKNIPSKPIREIWNGTDLIGNLLQRGAKHLEFLQAESLRQEWRNRGGFSSVLECDKCKFVGRWRPRVYPLNVRSYESVANLLKWALVLLKLSPSGQKVLRLNKKCKATKVNVPHSFIFASHGLEPTRHRSFGSIQSSNELHQFVDWIVRHVNEAYDQRTTYGC